MANRVNSFNVQGNTYGVEADLTFDTSPTIGSSNPVTSDGIAQAIQSVTLGDSISYGRTDGTPVGYCSISYGTNNSATDDYCVSIGDNNINTSRCGIVAGRANTLLGAMSGVSLGETNSSTGYTNVAIGLNGQIGTKISGTVPPEPDYNAKVFIGYVNLSSKKIYYDPDMENQITVTISTNESCYFVDKTTGQPNRDPGDVYLYKRTANYTYTLTKIIKEHVWLSNRCLSVVYKYKGPSYYDSTTGKNYAHYDPSTHTFSDDIESWSWEDRAYRGHIYFDVISGNFIAYVYTNTIKTIGGANTIKWLKVKTYKAAREMGNILMPSITKENILTNVAGTYAYIYWSNSGDRSKWYRVYSRPDCGDDCDITNTILDGQIVVDLAGGGNRGAVPYAAYYTCDIDGVPRVVRTLSATAGGSSYDDSKWNTGWVVGGSCSTVFGQASKTTGGGYGNIVSGTGCTVLGFAEGLAVFGLYNSVDMGPSFAGQCGSLVAGRSVHITSRSMGSTTAIVLGANIAINADTIDYSDRWFVVGAENTITNNLAAMDTLIFGSYINIGNSNKAGIFGHNHTVERLTYPYTYGYGNTLSGIPCVVLTKNMAGIWTGDGVTYDENTGTYSFPQNKLFMLRGYASRDMVTGHEYDICDCTELGTLGFAKSTDGTTLTIVPKQQYGSTTTFGGYPTVIGAMNTYELDSTISPLSTFTATGHCTIFGNYNIMKWRNNYLGINAYGTYLDISGDINQHSMFLGAYNTMTGTTGAMFVVGIGTSSTRKNGLAIFDSGVMAAPSSPDTINAGTAAMASTGLNSDKMVVTYGMMKDYTGPGGGGSSRPHVDTVTLVAANWDGSTFEQTVSLTGMTAGAIVIIQPIGSPQQLNYHNVYLDSQDADELTFKCTTTPTLDISVKVVYWV